jgi:hypothetical protein
VDAITKKLTALQQDIDSINHKIDIATNVVQRITKALDLGGKFFT